MPARRLDSISYFEWMLSMIENSYEPGGAGTHRLLLRRLYEMEFYATLDRDNDRIRDGLDLRNIYDEECRIIPWDDDERYSTSNVLEVMVAMCYHFEKNVMSNELYGNRFGKWFWTMIENAGLSYLNDANYTHDTDNYIAAVIRRICDRQYEYNGDGSFFPLRNPRGDMRKTDLWYQLQWYVTENFNGQW